MKYLLAETEANAATFAQSVIEEVTNTHSARSTHADKFVPAYCAVVSFQAWRDLFFDAIMSDAASGFLLEAHNDAVQSLALSLLGMWRPALQSLRSAIEGAMNSLYFADHPIEAILWESGRFRTSFSEFIKYFEQHPANICNVPSLNPIPVISQEYAELSKAVHGSALPFRMSAQGRIIITKDNDIDHSKWFVRHRNTIQAINLLFLGIYREQVVGTQTVRLRKAISLAISPNLDADLWAQWRIRLFRHS